MELEEKRMKKERNVTINNVINSIEPEYLNGIIVVTIDKDGTVDTGYSLENSIEGIGMLDITKDELKEWLV